MTDSRVIDVGDGMQLHIASSGTGPPLLLIHGFTGSAETWSPLRRALDAHFAVHAIDLPGHGRSASPEHPARYALSRLADDLVAVLDTIGIERTAVLGYSLGARAALRLALTHPARVAALVLESVTPGIADPGEREARRAADTALADAIESDGITAFVDRWERLPLWGSQKALSGRTRAALRAQRLANRPRGLARSLRGTSVAAEPPVSDRLPALAVPTLLIAGALDAKYVTLGRLMEQALPDAQLSVVGGAGHAVHLERPEAFAKLVADFLAAPR